MDVNEWMHRQFSDDRCHRWLDGSRTKLDYGYRSFVQVLDTDFVYNKSGRGGHVSSPHVWSVVRCSAPGGFRWTYYLTVHFYPDKRKGCVGGVLAKLKMCSSGIYARIPAGTVESEVTFDSRENAPKKLNKEIRKLRDFVQQSGNPTPAE